MSTIESLLTIEQVRAWAADKPADEVIGYTSMCADCPLARYLKEQAQGPKYVVSFNYFTIDGNDLIGLPSRLSAIIDLVDKHEFYTPVTAAEFLAILDVVASEVQP